MTNLFEGLTRVMAESQRKREAKQRNIKLQNRALELEIERLKGELRRDGKKDGRDD